MSGTTGRNLQRIAGITSCLIDGVAFPLTEASWSPSNNTRETMKGLDGIHGFSQMPMQGVIKVTLRDQGSYGIASFNSKDDSDVVLTLASGKTIGGSNMWVTEAITVSAAEATYEVTFEGRTVSETLAS